MCLLGLRLWAGVRFLQARIEDALCAPNRLGIIAHDAPLPKSDAAAGEPALGSGFSPDEQAVFVEPLAAACEILDQIDIKEIPRRCGLGRWKACSACCTCFADAGSDCGDVRQTREETCAGTTHVE